MKELETVLSLQIDRGFNPAVTKDYLRGIGGSGVIDTVLLWDQLNGWWTSDLWTPENTEWASVIPDNDSCPDAFAMAAYVAATTQLGVAVSTDAIRRGPAELLQTMLTLASATEGKATLMVGAGELRQNKPFGWKRSEGMARLEDLLRISPQLMECDGPIDFEGNVWKFKNAWLGGDRPYRPKILALGGGPKLRQLAGQFADGFSTGAPQVFPTPELFAAEVAALKEEVERAGRDPGAFEFNVWCPMVISDDEEEVQRALRNPLLEWITAFSGRVRMEDWALDNLESPFPPGWHYAIKLNPPDMTGDEIRAVCKKVTPAHVKRASFFGSPQKVANDINAYVDAGATAITIMDLTAMLRPVSEAGRTMEASLEVARILKG